MMYYFVPIMLKKPIWSHGLSLVGFWGLAFFYPLHGNPPLPLHADPHVPPVRGGDLHHRGRAGGCHGDRQFLRDHPRLDRGPGHEPADPLVLHRDVLLLPDVPAMRLPDDPDLPGSSSTSATGSSAMLTW